jgi:hypothetical protein
VRRGNAIIETPKGVYWGRKGLKKFFDLNADIDSTPKLKLDGPLQIYETNKANGENAQVSY